MRHVGFKLYDEDADLADQMGDTSSFVNLCTNMFRSYHKSQQDFLKKTIPSLTGEAVTSAETELALISMPAGLWDAYLRKAQQISAETGQDIGCEELMLRVLRGEVPAVPQVSPSTPASRPTRVKKAG